MRYFIVTSLVLAAALPSTARAQWKEIGKTANGNLVYVDPKSVKTKDGITSARIQVKFVPPAATPKGTWMLSRHEAMFNCAKKTLAAKSSTYYGDLAATTIIDRSVIKLPGYGPAIGGSMTQVALDYICKKK
jgi:hypothetical protein